MRGRRITALVVVVGLLAVMLAAGATRAWAGAGRLGIEGRPLAASVGTGFTYQGDLTDGGSPANGSYDFEFELYDAASSGSQVGSTVSKDDVAVSDGRFTVELDFGDVFDGTALWLGIAVRDGSSTGAYTALSPRQALTPAPYAHSLRPGASIRGAVGGTGALNLENTTAEGLVVESSGGHAVHVLESGLAGFRVEDANNTGLVVQSAGINGVYIAQTGSDGFFVDSAGSPSTTINVPPVSAFESRGSEGMGFSVGRADDHGMFVGSAGMSGVVIDSAGTDGIRVNSAGDDGFEVLDAGGAGLQVEAAVNHGVYVDSIGSPSSTINIPQKSAFEAWGSEGMGLSIGRADGYGVLVESAGGYGMHVGSSNSHAYHVEQSGAAGFRVEDATNSGVVVHSAGTHGAHVNETGSAGFRVDDAGTNGVYVQSAGSNGLKVDSASEDGVHVNSADDDGLYVKRAYGDGVHINSADDWGIQVLEADADADGNGVAGYFVGDVQVTGNLNKGSGSFRIDHPQDPENMYLSHSFVESPEMMNVYNGNVTTDGEGFATVTLPDYFEALNTDYRYQLTVIGTFAQAIVAEEIEGNQFVVQTDEPNVKVSWQVTGVRDDPYARANPITVEEEKPAEEQGLYLHPEAYGVDESQGISAALRSDEAGE